MTLCNYFDIDSCSSLNIFMIADLKYFSIKSNIRAPSGRFLLTVFFFFMGHTSLLFCVFHNYLLKSRYFK